MRSMIMFIVSLILGLIIGILSGALGGLGIAAWIASEIKKDEANKKFAPEVADVPTPAA